MPPPHWNEPLAQMLSSRLLYAIDSHRLDKTRLHSQPGLELNFTCEGRGSLHVGKKTFALAAGTLVVIPEPVAHQLEVHTPGRYARSVLCIVPKTGTDEVFAPVLQTMLGKTPFREPRCLYLDETAARVVRNLISRIAGETARQADWWHETALALACELLSFSARLIARSRPLQPPGTRLAEEAAAYIAFHLEDDLTLKKVANHFDVSREHLSRVFHQHFGITYQRYVANKRLLTARQLLMEDDQLSLLEIALASGFQSHSHFSRVFRRHEGVTPSEFRRLYDQGS